LKVGHSPGGSSKKREEAEELGKNKNERVKALALDEKVSRKLNNIINRIHEH